MPGPAKRRGTMSNASPRSPANRQTRARTGSLDDSPLSAHRESKAPLNPLNSSRGDTKAPNSSRGDTKAQIAFGNKLARPEIQEQLFVDINRVPLHRLVNSKAAQLFSSVTVSLFAQSLIGSGYE
jgi:hypothetical protein